MPDTRLDRWLWRGVVALIGSVILALGLWTCTIAKGVDTDGHAVSKTPTCTHGRC